MSAPGPVQLKGGFAPADRSTWQRIRRYAVPGWMIERVTAHRLVGDWRSACEAAGVDVTFDLPGLADRYGAAVERAVADDLRHFAPDLLRWHLPRVLGGHSTITPDLRIVLAHYGEDGRVPRAAGAPVLSVTTSPLIGGPQRLRLHCEPLPEAEPHDVWIFRFTVEDWTTARPYWDARHSAGLYEQLGGGPGSGAHRRLPFLRADGTALDAGELPAQDPGAGDPVRRAEWTALLHAREDAAGAFDSAGIEVDLTPPRLKRLWPESDPWADLRRIPGDLTRIAAEAWRLALAGAGDRLRMGGVLVEPTGPVPEPLRTGRVRIRLLGYDEVRTAPRLPLHAWRRPPDLEMLRHGLTTPSELHPLVRAALYPDAPPAGGPPGPAAPKPVRVRCGGEWHEVRSRGGVLEVPHPASEGEPDPEPSVEGAGCSAVRRTWVTGYGRLPRGLRAERQDLFLRAAHGDTPGVVALLDAGVDPRVRDGSRRGLLHVLPGLDHEVLLPRLLAAGADLEARDDQRRTPLQRAVHCGGSVALVRALLEAGARIDVVDYKQRSLSQVIRLYRGGDLAFLRRRLDEEHPGLGAIGWDMSWDRRVAWARQLMADWPGTYGRSVPVDGPVTAWEGNRR
ncbi:ankyrin repeat domain-containing protein [Streptomyces sp. NBC_00435]|uniref:ankyrin repeat domain-containing protein n=1 Tax=Streptomyces sp. NBC_00435 TaxID=2903649 RepID=UPI002E221597